MNDTQLFQRLLAKHGAAAPEPYEWLDGEPWYRGEPIMGRLLTGRGMDSETKAVEEMIALKGEQL